MGAGDWLIKQPKWENTMKKLINLGDEGIKTLPDMPALRWGV
jgi:hypothetical protein